MSGVAGGASKKSSSRSVATKTLIIQEYKRRLRDNIRSLNDNFINILNATKINTDDAAHKNSSGKMTEYYTIKNEMAARAALIVCDKIFRVGGGMIQEGHTLQSIQYRRQNIVISARTAKLTRPGHISYVALGTFSQSTRSLAGGKYFLEKL
ncbi:hypothetical protein Y032_0127g1381 [Ancylostoma ceylanicum]|uniref:Mediator complex subunit 22 n=1 Tax=Ancylostoma ceylanicum TaxID=53326 RepID=A0A016T844_9BILA|nr:hypothetical protein Y032_0127g1381 [Ancylostoma ceylanicum]